MNIVSCLTPAKWRKVLGKKNYTTASATAAKSREYVTDEFCQLMISTSFLPPTLNPLNDFFPTFGLIHTKLKNKLIAKKVERLLMCHRTLRAENCEDKEYNKVFNGRIINFKICS